MSYILPDFVTQAGYSASDWVEQYDRLSTDDKHAAYNERNQRDWWELNRRIRVEILRTEEFIKTQIRSSKKLSVRLLSWSQLANKLQCDRATLKHPKRYQWLNLERLRLLDILSEKKIVSENIEQKPDSLTEIKDLQRRLYNQRNQTSIWYNKYVSVKSELDHLKQILNRRAGN